MENEQLSFLMDNCILSMQQWYHPFADPFATVGHNAITLRCTIVLPLFLTYLQRRRGAIVLYKQNRGVPALWELGGRECITRCTHKQNNGSGI